MKKILALLLLACLAPGARAGGMMGGADELDENEGQPYFGFVKEVGGAPIKGAKVTVSVKNGATLVTQTDILGIYKIRNLDKSVKPESVTVSCSKDGYRQARVLRRPMPAGTLAAVETECWMQRQ